jgi:two-component system chemotaxis sensor kinase CheA
VPEAALREVAAALRASGTPHGVVVALERWAHEPARRRLDALAEQARALAQRLGRGEVHVEIVDDGARVEPARFAPLWSALVHLVRNAIDHGLEPPAARAVIGKGPARLRLEAAHDDTSLVIRVADDGRGIDWDAVAARAARLGLPHGDPAALEACLFADGLSTRDEVTETSGRGVGMSAVREAVEALEGRIRVATEAGRGTCFEVLVPLAPAARAPARRAA